MTHLLTHGWNQADLAVALIRVTIGTGHYSLDHLFFS